MLVLIIPNNSFIVENLSDLSIINQHLIQKITSPNYKMGEVNYKGLILYIGIQDGSPIKLFLVQIGQYCFCCLVFRIDRQQLVTKVDTVSFISLEIVIIR